MLVTFSRSSGALIDNQIINCPRRSPPMNLVGGLGVRMTFELA